MIANVALDYTEWAPPVTMDALRRDLDTYYAQHMRSPRKIIVWVHQWDYLVKPHTHLQPKYILEKIELDGTGLNATMRPAESSDGGTLWGVPVEVRDPENHAP